nr:MAG TPA: hypothetical protein [Caudoviricetes sp.]
MSVYSAGYSLHILGVVSHFGRDSVQNIVINYTHPAAGALDTMPGAAL